MNIRHTSPSLAAALIAFALAFPGQAVCAEHGQVGVSDTRGAAPQTQAAVEQDGEDPVHTRLHADFARFAESWVERLNNTHSEGRSRMQVVRDGDTFRARYHFIEKKSVVVRESPSRPGSYCGILRYHDTVYESVGNSKSESLSGEFRPVPGTARGVSEIFQFMNGKWR